MMKRVLVLGMVCLLLGACASSEEKSEEIYGRALSYYEKGDIAEARVEVKNAIKLNPKLAKAYVLLGNCSVKDQNWRGAFGAYAQAVQLAPELSEAQLGLGRLYLLSRQYDKAEEIVGKVIEREPENLDAHLLRAGVLLQTGDLDGAQRVLQAILAKAPDNTDAVLGLITAYERKKQMEQAHALLDKALAENPNSPVLYFKAASLAESEKRYDEAEGYYNRLLAFSTNKKPVQLMIIKMYDRSGQTEKARDALGRLVANEPDNAEYRLALAGIFLREKAYDKADALIRTYLGSHPDDIRMQLAQADVLLARGATADAKNLLRDVADKNAEHPLAAQALLKLGALLLKEKNAAEALPVLDEAARRDPSPEVLQLRARAKMITGDLEGAIADLRIVRKELPDNYEARYLLARAYLAQDKGLMAVEELHDILERNADYSPSRNLLVQYYARYGQWALAEEELAKLLEQTPDDPKLDIAMGDVMRMEGKDEGARKYYEQALKKPDGEGPALLRLGMMAEKDKRYAAALECYDKVLVRHPKSAAAIERKLFTLSAMGDAAGLASYKSALIAAMPDNAVLHDIFGRLDLSKNDTAGAEKEFRKARDLAPDWGVPYQRLIAIYLKNQEMDKVVAECKAVLAKRPDALVEEFLLGQIYQMQGKDDLAQAAYEKTLEKRPDFRPAANNLAYLYAERYGSDPQKLEKGLELAKLAADKDNPEALDTLGWIYHLLGNREQAIDALHKAYEKSPENKTIAYHFAYVLAKWSHTAEARRIIESALADGSDYPERKEMQALLKAL